MTVTSQIRWREQDILMTSHVEHKEHLKENPWMHKRDVLMTSHKISVTSQGRLDDITHEWKRAHFYDIICVSSRENLRDITWKINRHILMTSRWWILHSLLMMPQLRHRTHLMTLYKTKAIPQTHRFSISAWISFGSCVSFHSLSKQMWETFSSRVMTHCVHGERRCTFRAVFIISSYTNACRSLRTSAPEEHCLMCILHNMRW